MKSDHEIRQAVLENYRQAALRDAPGACCSPGCCSPAGLPSANEMSKALGYSENDVAAAPEGANMGLGCGNPQAIAALRPGEVVLDLGAGGGFDCFLAARQVGPEGRVIGVDMTPEMVAKARNNAEKGEFTNVEFRLGEIEALPVADRAVDVILSNCVINLSVDKGAVYREAFRVLRSGGRLAISDVVTLQPLPEAIREDLRQWAGCAAGALSVKELDQILTDAGFVDVRIDVDGRSGEFIKEWAPGTKLEDYVASGRIQARRP